MELTLLKFLNYKESIERIQKIIDSLGHQIDNDLPQVIRPTLICLYAVLKAQLKVIEYLNDEYLNCGMPWDEETGFPSPPSMIADAERYIDFFKPDKAIEIILRSFFEWTLFSQEKFICCCGNFSPRSVSLDLMLNCRLGSTIEGLKIKQLFGVKSDDKKHLIHHYDDKKKPSRVIDDLIIIFSSHGSLRVNENKIELCESFDSERVEQFNLDEFIARNNKLLDVFSEI